MNISEKFQDAFKLAESGDVSGAISAYHEILSHQPKKMTPAEVTFFGDVYNNMGALEANRGNDKEALDAFRSGLDIAPGNIDMKVNLAVVQHKLGNLDGAAATYEDVLQAEPAHRASAINLSKIYIGLGESQKALALLEAALKAHPNDMPLALLYAEVCDQLGFFTKALPVRRSVCQALPEQADSHKFLARTLHLMGNLEDALQSYTRCMELSSSDAAVLMNMGLAAWGLEKFDEAEKHLKAALKANKNLAEASGHLGRLLLGLKRPDDAREILDDGLSRAPDNAVLNIAMSRIEYESGQTKDALARLQRFESVGVPGRLGAEIYTYLGHLYKETGDMERSMACLERAESVASAAQPVAAANDMVQR